MAVPLGNETCIDAPTVDSAYQPSAAALGDGALVSWQSSSARQGTVQAVRVDAAGNVGGVVYEPAITAGATHSSPSVASLSDGGAVLSWRDADANLLKFQRFTPMGTPIGPEAQASTGIGGAPSDPMVAGLTNGGFAMTWVAVQQSSLERAAYTRRFDAQGSPLGPEVAVSATAARDIRPLITSLANGGYAVAWQEQGGAVAARTFDAGGNPRALLTVDAAWLQTPADTCYFPRATACYPSQTLVDIDGQPDGTVVIAWTNRHGRGDPAGNFVRRYDDGGTALAPVAQLEASIPDHWLALRGATDGSLVLTWTALDSNGLGVFLERR